MILLLNVSNVHRPLAELQLMPMYITGYKAQYAMHFLLALHPRSTSSSYQYPRMARTSRLPPHRR